jgi:hypothetical protein
VTPLVVLSEFWPVGLVLSPSSVSLQRRSLHRYPSLDGRIHFLYYSMMFKDCGVQAITGIAEPERVVAVQRGGQ